MWTLVTGHLIKGGSYQDNGHYLFNFLFKKGHLVRSSKLIHKSAICSMGNMSKGMEELTGFSCSLFMTRDLGCPITSDLQYPVILSNAGLTY